MPVASTSDVCRRACGLLPAGLWFAPDLVRSAPADVNGTVDNLRFTAGLG